MTGFSFGKEDRDARHGRYTARVEGRDGEAEITFTRQDEGLISADHTGAPDSLRGTGAAAALVAHMIEDARLSGVKIIPLCAFVRKQYERHPDWQDVMTLTPGETPKETPKA